MDPQRNPARRATCRLLALGDSYTIGEGVPPGDRWPCRLARRLGSLGRPVETIEFIAQTGWSSAELDAAVATLAPRGPYDLVSLMVGVNDQYRGGTAATFDASLRSLLERAVSLAGGDREHVLAVSIPDWGATPFAADRDRARITTEIDAFNAAAHAAARSAGVRWVDVTPLSRRATHDPGLVVADRLHPSAALYALWADAMVGAARQALAASG